MLVSHQVMAQFLTRLQQHGTLQHLTLIRVKCMEIDILDILFGMSHLKTLKMDKCKPLTAEILEQWLDHRKNKNDTLLLDEIKVDDRIIVK